MNAYNIWDVLSEQPYLIDPDLDVSNEMIQPYEEGLVQREEDYSWFLDSKYWQSVRTAIYHRAGFRCEKCGSVDGLEVHHLWYPPRGTELQNLTALILVCNSCHRQLHQ